MPNFRPGTLDKPPTYHMWTSKISLVHLAVGKTTVHWANGHLTSATPVKSTPKQQNTFFAALIQTKQTDGINMSQLWQNGTRNPTTHPGSISFIIKQVLSSHGTSSFTSQASPLLMAAAAAQDCIGLFGFLTGQLSSLWIPLQAQHYTCFSGQHIIHNGMGKWLCQQLLKFSHSLWLSCNQ